ncbi:MAG TPA: hypothetical protein VEK57_30785 [Thermoanaerobaculia bacterium]|nr:hypothetical protein [Thermoanaerobaculia bacterium]
MTKTKLLVLLPALLLTAALAPTLGAQCTLTLSEEGIVRLESGDDRLVTWNSVPGASSYLMEELIEGINEPSGPDFTFGGPYTESRNGEGRGITQYHVNHAVTYKTRFRLIVTALKREDPSWQPCKDDVLFVVEPDQDLAIAASLRIVPFAGKIRGRNGSDYSTSLIIAGTGLGPSRYDPVPPPRHDGTVDPPYDQLPKLYQGRVYFRPIGTVASETDPSVEYAVGGEETLVYDDIMATLGVTGIGTIEVRPKIGYPSPLVDAIIENRMPNGKRVGVRVAGVLGRHHVSRGDSATVGIRNTNDTRIAIGIRTIGAGGRLYFERFSADGHRIATTERHVDANTTVTFALGDLFATPLMTGDRVMVGYSGTRLGGIPGHVFPSSYGSVLFLTETGNDLDNPGVVYREPQQERFYQDGFDRFVVY